MTEDDLVFIRSKMEEILARINMNAGLFLYSDTQAITFIFGCPACMVNVVRQYAVDNDDIKHSIQHKNDPTVN